MSFDFAYMERLIVNVLKFMHSLHLFYVPLYHCPITPFMVCQLSFIVALSFYIAFSTIRDQSLCARKEFCKSGRVWSIDIPYKEFYIA